MGLEQNSGQEPLGDTRALFLRVWLPNANQSELERVSERGQVVRVCWRRLVPAGARGLLVGLTAHGWVVRCAVAALRARVERFSRA